MVAITTDTHRHQNHAGTERRRSDGRFEPAVGYAQGVGSQPVAPDLVVRALVIVAAVLLALAVAVGTAALGRVLDSQRGIPASSPAVVTEGSASSA
jgi:hypothetical protein